MAVSKSSKQHKQTNQSRQPWEYDTITEVIYALKNGVPEEQTRHLMIGAGIVMGSRRAYEEQNAAGKKGYWANQITDQAAEAGLIAEDIMRLSLNGDFPSGHLEEIASLKEGRVKERWSRPYGIIRTEQPYSSESLQRLGEYIEYRFSSQPNQQRLRELRQASAQQDREEIHYQKLKSKTLLEEKKSLTKYLIELCGRKQ